MEKLYDRKLRRNFIFLIAGTLCIGLIFRYQTLFRQIPTFNLFVRKAGDMFFSIKEPYGRQQTSHYEQETCVFPEIGPFDSGIMKYYKRYPPINCADGMPSLVYLDGFSLKVNQTKLLEKFPGRTFSGCMYKNLVMQRGSDKFAETRRKSKVFLSSINLLPSDDNIVIECYDENNALLSKSYMYVVHKKKDVEARCEQIHKLHQQEHKPKETLSVLLIGQDGLSKLAFQRAMPKTRAFILNHMHALELRKYNRVGENTFENIMPLLTGRHAHEFDGEWKWTEPFDKINYAFLWNNFRLAGYRTAVMLSDSHYITAFHYEKMGFLQPYVDYNSRAMVVATYRDKSGILTQGENCVGDTPGLSFHLNQWRQFTKMFNTPEKPYFAYHMKGKPTHEDFNKASTIDDIYEDFFTSLDNSGVLNNTLVVFFSDHGMRWGLGGTYNGIIEGNLPYMFLIFPKWFYKKYPEIYKTLKVNQQRLTTAFDVYATLKDIITFEGVPGKGDHSRRSISLFKEMPVDRTCKQAGIPDQYCLCLKMVQANVSNNVINHLVNGLLQYITSKTKDYRTLCHELSLDRVITLFEANTVNYAKRTFSIVIKTQPGGALYESYLILTRNMVVKVNGEVDRTNRYHGTAECIDDVKLFPFCYCVKKPDAKMMEKASNSA